MPTLLYSQVFYEMFMKLAPLATEENGSIDIFSKSLLVRDHQQFAICHDYGFAFSVIDLASFLYI